MKANNNFIYFFTLYVLSFSETVFFKQLLGVDRLIYESYIQQLTTEQIKDLCSLNNLWSLISYIAMPVILLIKIYIIASILDIGLFLFSQKTSFSQLLNIVLKAEFIFLVPMLVKFIWFYFFQSNYTLADLENFAPFSLMTFWNYKEIEPWYIYPLRTINIFELIYCIILIFLLSKSFNIPKRKSFIIVICSYGLGLFFWILVIMFLALNIN